MNYKYFVGIDMGKSSFQACLYHNNQSISCQEFDNNKEGINQLDRLIKKAWPDANKQTLFCMEHTGIYHQSCLNWLIQEESAVWLANPLAIKRSLGLVRGKSDRIDAQRISQYAARFVDQAKLFQPPREILIELQGLVRMRERMILAKNQLKVPLKESSGFLDANFQKSLDRHCKATLKSLEKDISNLEKEIEKLIGSDDELSKVYQVVKSVPGIGKITALELLLTTKEFKGIKEAKACACYAGIAPFEHSSGSSIRGRTRVSPLANKRLKKLLHMSALSAIRVNGELKSYYDRKVAEGKHKLLIINAVKNKIVHRVYACAKAMRLYQGEYNYQAKCNLGVGLSLQ